MLMLFIFGIFLLLIEYFFVNFNCLNYKKYESIKYNLHKKHTGAMTAICIN